MIRRIQAKTDLLAEKEKPRVFITSFPHKDINTSTYSAYSKYDTLTQAAVLAGGKIISEDLPEFSQARTGITVDTEWLLLNNPDIIIMHAVDRVDLYGYETDDISGLREELRHFMARPELASLKAVQQKQVYVFDGHFRNDASGGAAGAAYMARIFHPELFSDLNPDTFEVAHQFGETLILVFHGEHQKGILVVGPVGIPAIGTGEARVLIQHLRIGVHRLPWLWRWMKIMHHLCKGNHGIVDLNKVVVRIVDISRNKDSRGIAVCHLFQELGAAGHGNFI